MLTVLFGLVRTYLEFKLQRIANPLTSQSQLCDTNGPLDVKVDLSPCFLKNIGYNTRFHYFQNQTEEVMLGFDFNIRQNWVKSPSCFQYNSEGQNKACHFLDKSQNKKREKRHVDKSKSVSGLQDHGAVYGDFLDLHTLHIKVRNSNKFASILNILMAGLFMTDEDQDIVIEHTDVLEANYIPSQVSSISDGKLSLFHNASSFADEFLKNSQIKAISVWLDVKAHNGILALGDVPSKFVDGGRQSLRQIPLNTNNNSINVMSINLNKGQTQEALGVTLNAIFSLQADYIGIPEEQFDKLIEALQKFSCKKGANDLLICPKYKNKAGAYRLQMLLAKQEFSFTLDQLKHPQIKNGFLIRSLSTHWIVLGEPLFNRYFISLNYNSNKLSFGNVRRTFAEKLFETITFVRFIVCMFLAGFLTIWCYSPLRQVFKKSMLFVRIQKLRNSQEGKRIRYEVVDQNEVNFDDLKEQVDALRSNGGSLSSL